MHGLIRILAVMALASATGCAPDPWLRYGSSQADAQAAVNHCTYEATPGLAARGGRNLQDAGSRREELVGACMAGRGFSQQSAKPAPVMPSAVAMPIVSRSGAGALRAPVSRLAGAGGVSETALATQMMALPDGSRVKARYLVAACRSGDVTACILSDASHAAPPTRLTRLY